MKLSTNNLVLVKNRFTSKYIAIGELDPERPLDEHIYFKYYAPLGDRSGTILQNLSISNNYYLGHVDLFDLFDNSIFGEKGQELYLKYDQLFEDNELIQYNESLSYMVVGKLAKLPQLFDNINERFKYIDISDRLVLSDCILVSRTTGELVKHLGTQYFVTSVLRHEASVQKLRYVEEKYRRTYETHFNPELQNYLVMGNVF